MSNLRLAARRIAILALISLAAIYAISEVAYRLQKDPTDRAPKTVELLIPAGTAERVAAGEIEISKSSPKNGFLPPYLLRRRHHRMDICQRRTGGDVVAVLYD